ncbi:MAG: carbohydrate ABC transporter permease [Candidatus Hodarchaeales archaeon]
MMIWKDLESRPQTLAFISGILPFVFVLFFFLAGSFGFSTYFFPLGYFLYGWLEILGLSTFVSVVPDVASWFFFGIRLVGAVETAHLTITLIVFFGSVLILYGTLISTRNVAGDYEGYSGRSYWLIGGLLTLPLGFLAVISYFNTRPVQDLSLRDRITGELRKNKLPYLLVIPALVFLIFTYVIPIIRGFYITFFSYKDEIIRAFTPVDYSKDPLLWTIHAILAGLQRQDPVFIGLDNYLELFSQTTRATSFQIGLENNVYFVIIFVPGVVIVSLFLAVLLNNKLLKGENTYTTIFYMPVVTSILVVSVIWGRIIFEPKSGILTLIFNFIAPVIELVFKILNLITLGLVPANQVSANINWVSQYLMESVAMMGIWRRVGFDVLILLAGLKSIPDSLYEAAEIDGHGGWSKFKNITIPSLKGPLGVVIILEIINGWLVFQELYGLNVAQYGGNQTLAVYLIANYADPLVMTFASTVGYLIFGLTAFLGLLGRTEIKNVLKGFPLFALIAVLFSIPSNRVGMTAKSLGFSDIWLGINISWFNYDFLFLLLSLFCLFYYSYFIAYKKKSLESDFGELRIAGVFTLFVVPLYLANGYRTVTGVGFGATKVGFIPSLWIGLFLLVIGLLMVFAGKLVPFLQDRGKLRFLLPQEDVKGV